MTNRQTFCLCLLAFAAVSVTFSVKAQTPTTTREWVLMAAERLCNPASVKTGFDAESELPGSWLLQETPLERGGQTFGLKQIFALPGGDELRLTRSETGGQLRRLTLEYYALDAGALRPELQAMSNGACRLQSGREIVEEANGTRLLRQLDGDLVSLRWVETLQAPWPSGSDPGGIRVALIDSGLAYDLAIFRDRLARDNSGQPLGYDFWDMDPLPYDGDVARGAFLPIRHGTAVASILVREAPEAALIPLRYPRPDMTRMGDVVEHAAQSGARIIAMPLGSRRKDDWTTFQTAMKANPQLLAIVSAGNDGIDLDQAPLYPASLDIDNMLVVTSSDGFGKLAAGSNWGRRTVDLMLPAENQPVTDFRGARGSASGSSYAVPRLASLAARLLAADPSLSTQALKQRIFDRASPSPFEPRPVVLVGWLPNPAD
ncbi:S8 family serine peptidase [Roseibium sp.]|uniref:S8 family serine peptidase n=1 Tax=Roseibium sp. TaxID=1936156 RepID=UPI003A97374E